MIITNSFQNQNSKRKIQNISRANTSTKIKGRMKKLPSSAGHYIQPCALCRNRENRKKSEDNSMNNNVRTISMKNASQNIFPHKMMIFADNKRTSHKTTFYVLSEKICIKLSMFKFSFGSFFKY